MEQVEHEEKQQQEEERAVREAEELAASSHATDNGEWLIRQKFCFSELKCFYFSTEK